MRVSVSEAAQLLGVSSRQARRYASSGRISSSRIGHQYAVASRHLLAVQRTGHRGRRWERLTQDAALDLLSSGQTRRLTGSELSRLKHRLRTMEVSALCGQVLDSRVSLRSGSSVTRLHDSVNVSSELGLTATGSLEIVVSADAEAFVRHERLALDEDGRIAVVAGEAQHSTVLSILTLFAYGDTRESSAAHTWLHSRVSEL